jgi:hypothetical protein
VKDLISKRLELSPWLLLVGRISHCGRSEVHRQFLPQIHLPEGSSIPAAASLGLETVSSRSSGVSKANYRNSHFHGNFVSLYLKDLLPLAYHSITSRSALIVSSEVVRSALQSLSRRQ